MSEKQLCHPTCGRARGNVYFQKSWNLSSRQDPISPAVWCGNCTVMAFYVAVLRWLIIYTLHTPSPCYSKFSKLMTCSKHDGKLWPQNNKSLNSERKNKQLLQIWAQTSPRILTWLLWTRCHTSCAPIQVPNPLKNTVHEDGSFGLALCHPPKTDGLASQKPKLVVSLDVNL